MNYVLYLKNRHFKSFIVNDLSEVVKHNIKYSYMTKFIPMLNKYCK